MYIRFQIELTIASGAPLTKGKRVAIATVASPQPVSASAELSSPKALVKFARSGKVVASDGNKSILKLAEQAEVKIPSGCKKGSCGACKQLKLEGEVEYKADQLCLKESQQETDYVLTCVSYPKGRVVIDA